MLAANVYGKRSPDERSDIRDFLLAMVSISALADPEQQDVPVLTVAMDAGFQSVGTFNRAFKAATDLTPTEFRRLALAKHASMRLKEQDSFEIGKSG